MSPCKIITIGSDGQLMEKDIKTLLPNAFHLDEQMHRND